MTGERTHYAEGLAKAGLIVPRFVDVTVPDESDPDGWYESIEVSDLSSMYARQTRGRWHGRTSTTTELRWHWRDEPVPERGFRTPRPRPFLGPALRDLFRRRDLAG